MKRKLAILLVIVMMMSIVLVGCGQKEAPDNNKGEKVENNAEGKKEADDKTYTIKMAYLVPEMQSTHIGANEVFKKYVEEESNGRLKVELYPNGQLFSGDRQAIEAVQLGTIQMTIPAAAVLSGFEPKFQVFDLPYLFKSKEAAYEALDGELGQKLNEMLLPTGLRNLAFGENGFRHVSNNRGPVEKPEDLQGIKIRTMENPVHMAIFNALGANSTPMAFGDLYTALQQKTVDAQETPIPLVYTMKFYEVQDYYSLDGHVYAATAVLINDDFYTSLPEDLQEIIKEGAIRFKDEQRKINTKQEGEMLELLKKEGMKINELTPEQKEKFIQSTLSVYDEFEDELGKDIVDLAKKIRDKK